MARPDVLKSVRSVKVLRSRENGHSQVSIRIARTYVVWVEVVEDRGLRDHIDAADCIDHVDEPGKTDPDVRIDLDAEVVLHGGDRSTRPTERVGAIDLAGAASRQRDPQVPGDRQHRDLLRRWVEANDDHRLRQHAPEKLCVVVRPEKQNRKGARRVRRGRRRGAGGNRRGRRGRRHHNDLAGGVECLLNRGHEVREAARRA